ncbi:MAG: M2 family metallopeptidase [Patescibacteria group bacterium]
MSSGFDTFLRDYVNRLAPLQKAANEAYWAATTPGRPEDEKAAAEAAAAVRKLHADPGAYARLKAWQASGEITDPLAARQLTLAINAHTEQQIPPATIEEISRREQEIESRFTNFRPLYDGRAVSDNDLREILVREQDSARRRAAWEAAKAIGAETAPLILELVAVRNDVARGLGFPDYYRMRLTLDELDEAELFAILDELKRLTDRPFAAAKSALDAELARRFGVAAADLRPWHYADPFFQEPPPMAGIDPDRFFARLDPVAVTRSFYAGLGLPVDDLIARSDLFERAGKNQHAYCTDIDRAGDVRVLANVRPNEQWMSTLLHEFGHAAYSKYHDRNLPYLLRDVAHIFITEAVAMMMGRLTGSADWLHRQAGVAEDEARAAAASLADRLRLGELIIIRWGLVMVYFERELYRDPGQDLNGLWWRLVKELQLVTPPEGRHAPDWASKIHLGTVPVYYHNYILGALAASQIKAALLKVGSGREGLAGDRAAGEFLRERIFAVGMRYPWQETLRRALGEGLTPEYFVREFVE